jgi:hypothetical protein
MTAALSETYSQTIHRVLNKAYAPLRHATETLARHSGATPRAARNWLDGECAPRAEHLILLMANCAELRAEIDRLVREAQCDGP